MRKTLSIALMLALILTALTPISTQTVNAANSNYTSNRSPLIDTPFVPLPVGAVVPKGWLLTQLQLQRDGLTGYSENLYPELTSNSAWLGGTAANSDWERPPYYVKGLVALAYTLNDANLKTKAQKWIDWALNSQKADGSFGPSSNNDWWPRMVMLYALMDYYDATNDSRVPTFLSKYFQYQINNLGGRPLSDWGKARAGDNLDAVMWLYNKTGDSSLTGLMDTLRNQAYDWADIFTNNTFYDFGGDFHPQHGVNVAQAVKLAPLYYQKSNSTKDKNAFSLGDSNLMHNHGQPHNMPSGTEFLTGLSSTRGVETCATVERMQCDEIALRVLGNASIGDQLEKIAFNALPAAMSKTFRQHQYYTLPNQVQSKYGSLGFGQDYANGILPGAESGYPCCRYNLHMGWPYFVKSMWAATTDNGLGIMTYGPSEVNAKVANGVSVKFVEDTGYPFEEQVRLTFTSSQSVAFPLKLRIPTWCVSPVVKVNGVTQSGVTTGTFYTVNRTWNNNDTVTIDLPMPIKTSTWINNSVAVERGPLVYSLKIGESWNVRTSKSVSGIDFSEYEITPNTSWNYGLVIDPANPSASITVNKGTIPSNPFIQSTTPVTLTAPAKKIGSWGLAANNLVSAEPPLSPLSSASTQENVTLVPFGAENIRLTYFPVVGTPASSFSDSFSSNADNWLNYDGTWTVSSGQYCVNPKAGVKATAKNTTFSDFTYEADVSVGASGNAGLIFRVTNPTIGGDSYSGYYVGIDAGADRVELGKANNNWTSLNIATVTINPDTLYHIKVVASGSNIKVYVSDMVTPKINITDTTWTSGQIGVRTYQANAKFDNIVVTSSTGATPTPAPTPTPTPTPATFNDDFNDGNANGWTTYGGTWAVSSYWYTVAQNQGAKSIAGGTNFSNLIYEADVQISTSGTNNNSGLLFRVSNPATGADAYNGYYAGIQSNRVMLGRSNGTWTEIGTYAMTISMNTTYHMKVIANGSSIKVYVGDMLTPKIDITDSTWTSGAIGLRTYDSAAKFDNLVVSSQ